MPTRSPRIGTEKAVRNSDIENAMVEAVANSNRPSDR